MDWSKLAEARKQSCESHFFGGKVTGSDINKRLLFFFRKELKGAKRQKANSRKQAIITMMINRMRMVIPSKINIDL
jgi:hypothetical protein